MESSLLAFICVICAAAWIFRTVLTVPGRYPVLISYLAYDTISPAIFWIARPLGLRMEYTLVSSVLGVALAIAALLEIHNIVMERYIGFRKLGGFLMQTTIWASGVSIVALTFLVPVENLRGWSRMIPFQAGNTHWGLAVVALSLATFLFYFELKPSRNIRVYLATFAVWFLTIASTHTVVYQLGPETRDIVLPLRASVYIVLTITGAIFFSKAGEQVPAFAQRVRASVYIVLTITGAI